MKNIYAFFVLTIFNIIGLNAQCIVATVNSATICSGSSATLTASGASSYAWSPSTGLNTTIGASVIANPSVTTTYTITYAGNANGSELVNNGDFEQGYSGFTFDNISNATEVSEDSIAHGKWAYYADHTTGNGNYLIAYHWRTATTDRIIWQNITSISPLDANKNYLFSYWIKSDLGRAPNIANPDYLEVFINNQSVGTYQIPSNFNNQSPWTNISFNWNSLSYTTATIQIKTHYNSSNVNGGIILLDDISFRKTCSNITTATVIVDIPVVTANASSNTVCAGTSVTLMGGGASTYTWTGGVSNGVSFTPSNTKTYTVTGTDANGCSNKATTQVTVKALPTVSVTASINSICASHSTTLTASGASNYTWSPSSSLNTSTGVTVTASPTVTTTYTVTGAGTNGCANTTMITVIVKPLNIYDINGDGVVDPTDGTILTSHYNQTDCQCHPGDCICRSDINQDGTVNVSDYLIWLGGWVANQGRYCN